MATKERREHLQRAIAEGGTIMTAGGALSRKVPETRADLKRKRAEIDVKLGEVAAIPEGFPYRGDLAEGGIKTLQQFDAASDDDLVKLKHIGAKRVEEMREAREALRQ